MPPLALLSQPLGTTILLSYHEIDDFRSSVWMRSLSLYWPSGAQAVLRSVGLSGLYKTNSKGLVVRKCHIRSAFKGDHHGTNIESELEEMAGNE